VGWWRHDKRHARGRGPTQGLLKAWGPRARAERTLNIWYMVVTLEVLKLSGWLKADARCRVEGKAHAMRGERCEPGGGKACMVWWRHTSGMHGEKARLKAWGPRARAERT
jgi:hypothetical protein